ncbi:IS66 family insertion sequence element accessory protein TnpB [Ruthenibacterium lactatiformans]|uniref:IS66 family insertion sequence element accessory protein TnpB n=1 Tax=Ruthenibacterium lactatiformans TaxID=1550024 RepID=UPI000A61FC11
MVERQFHLEPCTNNLFLICGRHKDHIKAMLWERDGFVLLYKRMENGGDFQWPRSKQEMLQLS